MNDVTRSMDATGAAAASVTAERRRSYPSGWWGMMLLLATEAALFGTILASYYYLRFQVSEWPPPGIEPSPPDGPLLLTAVLVATSVPIFLASRAARLGRPRTSWRWLALALLVQCFYLAGQIGLFIEDYNKFSPTANAYTSIYFTLVAAHGAHVVVGMLLLAFLIVRLLSGLTNYRLVGVRVVALYWYFVNLIAIPVVLTQVFPSL
ncbi:MAG TPA: cytochrome c oxidase subunit 3 [Thermoleophilaceae bacterium]|nr:cytochrome c oxidase subunit 3 [Thermoleophilaceae bacterium]